MSELQQLCPITLQKQLYQKIMEQLKNGTYKVDKLPTELELCSIYNVSRVTVRKVLGKLVEENHLTKIRGKGTFVTSPQFIEDSFAGGSFTDTCIRMNAIPTTKIINIEIIPSPDKLNGRLGSCVIHMTRLRLINHTPCIVEEDFFPESFDFLQKENLENLSILKFIYEKTGILPSDYEDFFQISHANKTYASLPNCSTGHALMQVSQNVYASDNTLIYINEQYIFSERYIYSVRSNKQPGHPE